MASVQPEILLSSTALLMSAKDSIDSSVFEEL